MHQPPTGRRWLTRSVAAAVSAAVLVPLSISGASAHPGHDDEIVDPPAAAQEATDWNNYEKVLLSKNTGEPIDLAVLPDSRVLHTARDGVVRLTDTATGRTTQVAKLDVYANSEDGLQGISLDPNFEENNYVYMVYAPRVMEGTSPTGVEYPETTPQGSAPNSLPAGEDESYWNQWLGYNQLSRFTFDPEAGTIDLASEREIIKVDAQRGQCCHVGADMAWDADGNLFLSTGDNTPAGTPGANGYTPINNAPGMNPGFDARRGAGNTNDLRGKILRINPIEDLAADTEVGPGSTYTIPEGNLFDGAEQPDLVREEIYVMGVRNPFRIDYDLESASLSWGDYGPDAGAAQPDRGPMGYVEWQLTTEPMNGGWPYCHGPNAAYNEWDFATGTPGEQFFDCEAGPQNNSTWNTGLDQLPPVTAPQVYYGDNPGDQPEVLDPLVELGVVGQAPMGGPIYRFDENLDSDVKFPEYWDGHPFMAEFSQDYVVAFTMDELSSAGQVTAVEDFLPNSHLETVNQPIWDNVMDMEFGPDGALYVLEYGDGFFRQNPDAGLYKVTYGSENTTPRAFISADPVSGSTAPLEVTFDASATTDAETPNSELTFDWDFDADGEYDAQGETVTHTFTDLGQYNVQLRVTDPGGNFGIAIQRITVGNTAPEITLSQPDGAIFNWGDAVPYTVSVNDAEDGDQPTCRNIQYTFGLGHNEHAHPEVSGRAADTEAGCGFTIQTSPDAVEHGEGEKIFGTLVVTYTDQAQGQVPAITGEATHILKPEVQQAEWYDAAEGVEVVDDASAGAGGYITSLDEGDSFSYSPIALHHAPTGEAINEITVRGSGEGTVSLGWTAEGAEAPEALAEFEFTGEGWQDVTQALSDVPEGSGSIVVTGTGGVDVDHLTFAVGEGPVEPVTVPVDQVSIGMFSLIPWVEEAGLEAVLQRLSEIGFKNIEPFGGNFEGYTAEEFRALADEYGLSVKSSHYNVDENTFDETLEYVTTLGQEYVGSGGFPAPGIGTYENTLATAEAMNRLGQRTVEAGLEKFFGHNHDGEFRTTYEHEGETLSAWEILVRETNPEYVTFQLDVAWAAHAGVDVPALIAEYGDRIELLHVKDAVNLAGEGRPTFTNLGEGDVPLQEILAAGQEAGVRYYVMEYDVAPQGEDFATTGFEYLTGLPAGEPQEPITVPVEQVSIGMFSLIPWVNEVGLEAVLERLSEIGFQNIEPFGSNFAGYTAEEFRALADKYGLSVKSSHYNVNEATFDETLEYVKTLGQEYVGSGGFPQPGIGTYENTLATAEAMNRLGERTVEAGLTKFFGHNHDGEFRTTYEHEGETLSAWEILVRETNPEYVTFQLDVAWAAHAGVDVPALIEEYGDRIELLHVKDAVNLAGEGRPTFTNLGEGDVPLQEILAAAQEAGVKYYVLEYDRAPEGEDFATTGFEYLTGLTAGEPERTVAVTTQVRCLAGNAYLAVRALNDEDVPLTITLDTPYGSKTVENVAPGKNAYQAFPVRADEVEAGTSTVTATDAEGRTATVESEYAASSCG